MGRGWNQATVLGINTFYIPGYSAQLLIIEFNLFSEGALGNDMSN